MILFMVTATVGAASNGRGPGHGGPSHGPEGALMKIAGDLELTDDQMIALRHHLKKTHDEARPLMEKLHGLEKQAISIIDTDSLDETRVRAIAVLQAEVMIEMTVHRLMAMHEFRKKLTVEQVKQAREILEANRGPRGPKMED
jgi:Spy/CpxP family protein refolding chaperone